MTQPRRRAFTFVEILCVLFLLALVAVVVTPQLFYTRGRRSKVSRVQADQRSLATALASYYVDNNGYPLAMVERFSETTVGNSLLAEPDARRAARSFAPDLNGGFSGAQLHLARSRVTFAQPTVRWDEPGGYHTLTTPIAYITSHFRDPFSPGGKLGFSYLPDGPGFLLASFEPRPEGSNDPTRLPALVEAMSRQFVRLETTPFDGRAVATSKALIRVGAWRDGRAYTYDPTNGTTSTGTAYRTSD